MDRILTRAGPILFFFWLGEGDRCAGYLMLSRLSLEQEPASSGNVRASHCGDLSRGVRTLGLTGFSSCSMDSVVVAPGLQRTGSSSCGSQAQLLCQMWNHPGPGIKPMFPALAGRFFTTELPGKCLGPFGSTWVHSFLKINFSFFNLIFLHYTTTESPIFFKLGCFMAFSLFMAFNCVTLIFKTDAAFPERIQFENTNMKQLFLGRQQKSTVLYQQLQCVLCQFSLGGGLSYFENGNASLYSGHNFLFPGKYLEMQLFAKNLFFSLNIFLILEKE